MRKYGVGRDTDVFAGILAEHELALGFAFQETHREALRTEGCGGFLMTSAARVTCQLYLAERTTTTSTDREGSQEGKDGALEINADVRC